MEWWLALLMMFIVLRPVVGNSTNMDWLWAHWCHLLGLSPHVDPVPDRILFVLKCLALLVASALDTLIAVLEDYPVLLEKLDPCVIKLVVLVPVLHFVQQFVEDCFVYFPNMILHNTDDIVSTFARGQMTRSY